MTKLKFDEYALKQVKEAVKTTAGNVQVAKYNSDFHVPGDFVYAGYLHNVKDQIAANHRELNSLINWMEKTISDVNDTFVSINNEAKNLEIIKLREKSQSVMIH